ncbi:MAG: dihydrofolate reductase family protein [Balneolaceae bacterium]|nr:dihydrofolate reductase family protein [Balneolaceae bacterium]
MRDLVYYVAASLDGFIAGEGGSLDGFAWDEEYGADLLAEFPETFPAHLQKTERNRSDNERFDAVLMGRKTYEVGLSEGTTNPYPTLDQYLFSRTLEKSPDRHVELVSGGAEDRVAALKQDSGKDIWLCGGAELAAALWGADLIDELIVKLNPVIFGSGVPLFAGPVEQRNLKLTESNLYNSGHAVLRYKVNR